MGRRTLAAQAYAYVTGGLTLNGTVNLGSANGSIYGRLYFEGTRHCPVPAR